MVEASQNKVAANPLLKTVNRKGFAGRSGWLRALAVTGLCWLLFFALLWLVPLPAEKGWSTIITDEQGTVVHAYLSADDKWRMKTGLDEISPLLQQAIVEKEDRWFYHHPGVNPLAMGRAFFRNLFTGRRTSGASTITMQVARSLSPGARTYTRKLLEIFRAFQLELRYSKKEILQLYLNHVPY
ncbi:MAG: transglycosylase domain-containing protein, partial [Flavihumibacter sp.]